MNLPAGLSPVGFAIGFCAFAGSAPTNANATVATLVKFPIAVM